MNEHQTIRALADNDYAVEFGKISLTKMKNYQGRRQDSFQIYCTHHKIGTIAEDFKDVDRAIVRFLELKRRAYDES